MGYIVYCVGLGCAPDEEHFAAYLADTAAEENEAK